MKFFNIFNKKIVAKCGHETLKKDNVTAFGVSCKTEITIIDGKTDYCHRCLEEMTIKCFWCGKVIFIGERITLCVAGRDFALAKDAVWYNENKRQAVGCKKCAKRANVYLMGLWIPPGRVKSIMSPSGSVASLNSTASVH